VRLNRVITSFFSIFLCFNRRAINGIQVNSKILEKTLSKIIPAVPTRTPMPILENFLFEIIEWFAGYHATDLKFHLNHQ